MKICRFIRTLVLTIILICLSSGVVLANPSFSVKVDGVNVSSDLTVSSPTAKINVSDLAEEALGIKIKLNGKSVSAKTVAGEVYSWEANASFSNGSNDLVISDDNGNSAKTYRIFYTTLPVPSLALRLNSLNPTGKIEAFNKALTITYPKDDILVDDSGIPVSSSINIEILSPDDIPDKYHYWASPNIPLMFRINTSDSAARLLSPGKLTLTYDNNISLSISDQIAIWYSPDDVWNDDDNKVLGGVVDSKKFTVTVPFQFTGTGYYAVFLPQRQFEDFIKPSTGVSVSWSYSPVMSLWGKGVAEPNCYGNNINNGPEWFGLLDDAGQQTSVTRLEFATMLVKGWGVPLVTSTQSIFTDVTSSDQPDSSNYFGTSYSSELNYYSPSIINYIESATRKGIVTGYPDRSFKPMNKLTREEAAVMLARVASLELIDDDEKIMQELSEVFEDADQISQWAAPSVLAAYKAKLIVGMNGSNPKMFKFSGSDQLSRAQAITFTYRLLKKYKKI